MATLLYYDPHIDLILHNRVTADPHPFYSLIFPFQLPAALENLTQNLSTNRVLHLSPEGPYCQSQHVPRSLSLHLRIGNGSN